MTTILDAIILLPSIVLNYSLSISTHLYPLMSKKEVSEVLVSLRAEEHLS